MHTAMWKMHMHGPPHTLLHRNPEIREHWRDCKPAAWSLTGCQTVLPVVEREMMMLKVRVASGEARTEVLQLAQIFRAKVVDVSDTTLTMCVSGDTGKVSLRRAMFARVPGLSTAPGL